MGPLVPEIISSEFNYVIALFIGMGFGFALEQAGFGSTRKLVGLFYGYDFTVLKVFFTAGVTAMIGITLLNHLGMLNVDIIYIHPTFVKAAIIGGLIMGGGFILGGFCPGTSMVAAVSGKLDGVAFVGGAFLGVFIFAESWPLVKDLFYADNMGDLLAFEVLNMSREMFALMMLVVAVLVFIAVSRIENNINHKSNAWQRKWIWRYGMGIAVAMFIVLFTLLTPTRLERMDERIDKQIQQQSHIPFPFMIDMDKLAFELTNNYYKYNVIDVRSAEAYKAFHIPTAINIPLSDLHKASNRGLLRQNIKTNVFYGDDEKEAVRACLIAKYLGNAENYALQESALIFDLSFFKLSEVLEPSTTKEQQALFIFRKQAGVKLKEIGEAVAKMNQPVKKKKRRVQGGCT